MQMLSRAILLGVTATPRATISSIISSKTATTLPALGQPTAPAAQPTFRRDLQQAAGLVPPTVLAAALTVALTYLLAPLPPAYYGLKLVFAGAVAGIISRSLCAPLEMISTVIMCGRGGNAGVVAALGDVWKQEGLKGLFKGNGANILKVAPSRGLQFLVYESVKRSMLAAGVVATITPQARLFAAGVAGMCAAAVVYPLDVAKTLLTLYPDRCKGVIGALRLAAGTGLSGLYRGLGPTLVAMFPYVGVEFMVYESLKGWWESTIGVQAGTVALLLLGAIGGAASQAVAHPLDVVRRRLQMQGMRKAKTDDEAEDKPQYTNMVNGLYYIGKHEGPSTLYRGLAPTCLEKVPSTAIGYFIYEGMKAILKISSV